MNIYTTSKEDIESLYFPIDAPIREELKEEGITYSDWGGGGGKFQPMATEAARLYNTGRSQSESHKKNRGMARSRSVTVNGIEYASQRDAAKNNRVSPSVISQLIKLQGRTVILEHGHIICPHCQKAGTNHRSMRRWHYDNCKKS